MDSTTNINKFSNKYNSPTARFRTSSLPSSTHYFDLAAFMDHIPDVVFVFDRYFRYCYVNQAMEMLTGRAQASFLGQTNEELGIPSELCSLIRRHLEKAFTGKKTIQFEFDVDGPQGRRRLQTHLVPQQNDQGIVTAVLGIGRDVSRFKQIVQRLHHIQQNLKDAVKFGTAELRDTIQTLAAEVQDRLGTEAELDESQQRLTEVQRIAQLGNWEWDPIRNTLWWSDQVYRIFGQSPETFEPSYDRFVQMIHPDDRVKVQDAMDFAVRQRRNFSIKHRLILPDGEIRFVFAWGNVDYDEVDQSILLRGSVQDVTEMHKKHIDTIQDQTVKIDKQAHLLDLAHDMISIFDLEGRILYWNAGAEQTYGWTRGEAQGRIIHQLLKTEFKEPRSRILSHILHVGQWKGEAVKWSRDGNPIDVESRWVLQRDDQQRPEVILAIDRDITQRKQAEMALEQACDYAESIIATIPDALIVLDDKLRVVSTNDSFYRLFKITPDEVLDRPIFHLPGGQWDHPDLRVLLEEILPHNTQLRNFELTYLDDEATSPTYLLLNARRLHQKERRQELILLAIQDITQRKEQDKAIAIHQKRLHALTEELLQTEETQREKTAQALHDSIGPTLAFAKRELTALEKTPSLPRVDSLRRINQQITQAIQQTRTLTSELSPPTLRMFGLEAALEELADQFAAEHDLDCTTLYPEQTISITKNHRTLLYRSVRELLVNTVKHAEASRVVITIERNNDEVEILYEDDGQGFDPIVITSPQEKDGGFGLFSIQERLKYIGGHFVVESSPGRGCRILLKAPLSQNQKGDEQNDTNPTSR